MSEMKNSLHTSKTFEEKILTRDEWDKKVAFFIGGIGVLLALLGLVVVIILLPLKQTEIELYTVDNTTRRIEKVTRVKEKNISSATALVKAFAANYQLVAVETPKEAIKALSVILPGFEQFMLQSQSKGQTFAVFNGSRNIGKDELASAYGNQDIRIAPVIISSKWGGVFQTIIGAVLVAAYYHAAKTRITSPAMPLAAR